MADINYSGELWKTIPQARDYEVSTLGRVRRATIGKGTFIGRIVTSHPMTSGHMKLKLVVSCGKKKSFWVHRLVAEAFVPREFEEHVEVCHNDGKPANNSATNLRWDTHAGNMADRDKHGTQPKGENHHSAKYSADIVRAIRSSKDTAPILAERFGMQVGYIYRILAGAERRYG